MNDTTAEPMAPAAPEADVATATMDDKEAAKWRGRIEACRTEKRKLIPDWATNVDYRRGKPFQGDSDQDRIAVSVDWTQTKAKQAQLFSQVPQVMLTPKHPSFAPAIPVFAQLLNDTLALAKLGTAMDEVLPDVINAAGLGAVIVGYESRMDTAAMPSVDTKLMPAEAAALIPQQPELMGDPMPRTRDARFYCRRISPADLLWPKEFRGSDFDDAPWLGFTGRMTWSEATVAFQLKDEVKDKVCGAPSNRTNESLTGDMRDLSADTTENDVVEYDEVYYWCYRFDPECMSFCKLRRLVFVRGLTQPVVNDDWKGQEVTPDGKYVGALKYPIRVLTLTYISDEAVPPSDTAIGRPQVDELIKSRSQIVQQRDFSQPMRWADVNRIDPMVLDAVMKGTFQGIIPTNGDGTKVIGEVARAMYPREDFEFDRTIKSDLYDAWQTSPNQSGNFNQGERSASEAQIVQQNFNTRIGYERARVSAFVCGVAEVMAGLLVLFGDFAAPNIGQDGMQRLQQWDMKAIPQQFVYSIRTDSTVLLDSQQRLSKLMQFMNMTAKSGFIDIEPIMREIASLSGLDPDQIVKRPNPPAPEPPKVSLAFSGEDLVNPMVIAILMKSGNAPTPDELAAAIKLQHAAHGGVMTQALDPAAPGPEGGDAAAGAGAAAGTGEMPAAGPKMPPIPGVVEDQMPHWQMGDRINTRRNDGSAA